MPTVDTLKADARDPLLGREIASLETQLFAGQPASADWSPRRFIRRVSAARRNLRGAVVRRKADSVCRNTSTPSAIAFRRMVIGGNPQDEWNLPVAEEWAVADMKKDWKTLFPFEK